MTKSLRFKTSAFYAPGAAYQHGDTCTLLRNPHIARNEELQLSSYDAKKEKRQMRHFYFRHLTDLVMVDSTMLAAERLGGADYDGDMVKTIADPILNECVRRNYEASRGIADDALSNEANIPLLMIPSATPLIRSAEDLEDETEVLAILTGLEIDSAKSGIRPDLDEYLKTRRVRRTPFLQYKNLVDDAEETRRAWYEETHQQRIKAFFKKIDWDKVDSNLERLPYLALQLKKHTPAARAKPARDHELFTFAQQPDWKEHLDGEILEQISALLRDYEACLSRIRACRVEPSEKKRKSDIARILFARGQEELWDTDELYAQLGSLPPERVAEIWAALNEAGWQFLREEERMQFLLTWLPEFEPLFDLFSDFRSGGYRVLSDLLFDIQQENEQQKKRQLHRPGDSAIFDDLMDAYLSKRNSQHYREAVSARCRQLMNKIVRPQTAVRYVEALGKRNLLWNLLLDALEPNVLEVRHAE